MSHHQYGIVIRPRLENGVTKWRIAIFDGCVTDHRLIDVRESLFDFQPVPGCSVKAKFDDVESEQPSVVSKESQWIRDVEVINSQVVIFVIVLLSHDDLRRSFNGVRSDLPYYIIQNEDTDCRRIAIPKTVMDEAIANRCSLQKGGEPLVYRVGVHFDPFIIQNMNQKVYWKYYEDIPMVPIFELYMRENMLPFLYDTMIYGVLEGIAIAKNENGVLFYTPGMGCSVLSSVTRNSEMPALGSVHYILAKRCLPEQSFGFPCFYELLPDTRDHKWENIRVIPDEKHKVAYIEARSRCVQMTETSKMAFIVPNIGKVYRGLEQYYDLLTLGKKYYFRIEFQKVNNSFVPVIVDLCLEQDESLQCRIVHISKATKQYFAVLEPSSEIFDRVKRYIAFIKIPFRTLFCAHGVFVEEEELMRNCYHVRVRRPTGRHQLNVEAVHVDKFAPMIKDPEYSVVNKTVWLKTMASFEEEPAEGPIILRSERLEQKIFDFSRFSLTIPRKALIGVAAQFAETAQNEPIFWVRGVASTTHTLPAIKIETAVSLPSLAETLGYLQLTENEDPKKPPKSARSDDENDDTQSVHGSVAESENLVMTESFFAASISASDRRPTPLPSQPPPSRNMIVTESCFDNDSVSTVYELDKTSIVNNSPGGRYREQLDVNEERRLGLAPPGSTRAPTSIVQTRYRKPVRPVKYGMRKLQVKKRHEQVLEEVVYHFVEDRLMFVENEDDALSSWFHTPNARVTSTKKALVNVMPVEILRSPYENNRNRPNFSDLIRFVVLDKTMEEKVCSVVVAVGGYFPKMPKSFQLGELYKVEHFSFHPDRMVRFGGFAYALRNKVFQELEPSEKISHRQLLTNTKGHEYLRFTTNLTRRVNPEIRSEIFELWSCDGLPGFVIVEKEPELMKYLEPFDAELHSSHIYSCIIEPVAGGPMEVGVLHEDERYTEDNDIIIYWRLVMEFSDTVPMPVLVRKVEQYKPVKHHNPNEYGMDVNDYGMWKTVHINSELALKRLDMLRAANDPRVRMLDGPELKPEIEVRKVEINVRRESMLNALDIFFEKMPELKENGFFHWVFVDDLRALIARLKPLDDDNHSHSVKKRHYSLDIGMNYLVEELMRSETYKKLNESPQFKPFLKVLADSIGLNSTYIRKTEDIKNMIHYLRAQKLIPYL